MPHVNKKPLTKKIGSNKKTNPRITNKWTGKTIKKKFRSKKSKVRLRMLTENRQRGSNSNTVKNSRRKTTRFIAPILV